MVECVLLRNIPLSLHFPFHLPLERENVDDERGEEGGGQRQSAGAAVLFVVGEEVGQGEAAAQADQVGGEGDQGEDGLRYVKVLLEAAATSS